MVNTCVVNGCHNRADDDVKRSFFCFPTVRLHEGEKTEELSRNRRMLWISHIYRKDFGPSKYSKDCSDHFVTGKKADLYDWTHPDWAPSLNLKASDIEKTDREEKMKRHERQKKRMETKKQHEAASTLIFLSEGLDISEEPVDEGVEAGPSHEPLCESSGHDEFMAKVQAECQRLISENQNLKKKLTENCISPDSFKDNDRKVTYYTGLPGYLTLMALFEFLEPYTPDSSRIPLTKFQKLSLC